MDHAEKPTSFFQKHWPALSLLGICAIIYVICLNFTKGVHGGADSYHHFELAKYAFDHPENLLDNWGKPFFTLLTSVFAQFGLVGVELFNATACLLSAWFGYLIVRKFKPTFAWLIIPLIFFTPVYFQATFSALTEPLFSLLLMASIWLFMEEKYWKTALLLSFLPLVRSEGFFLILPCIASLIWLKQWRSLPWLLTGTLIYSLIGGIALGDFLWLWNTMPYGTGNIYPQGSFLHYVGGSPQTLGWQMSVVILIGLFMLLLGWIRKQFDAKEKSVLFLLVGSGLGYVFIHSMLYGLGWGGSLGLTRILAGAAPLLVVLGWLGMQRLALIIPETRFAKTFLAGIALFILASVPFHTFLLPVHLMPESVVVKKAADWMLENEKDDRLWYTFSPVLPYFGERDPYNTQEISLVYGMQKFKPDAMLIWDAHFGPNEGGVPLDSLISHPYLQQIQYFQPDHPFTVLGGHPYEVRIFETLSEPREVPVYYEIARADFSKPETIPSYFNPTFHKEDRYLLSGFNPFFGLYEKPLQEALDAKVETIEFTAKVHPSPESEAADFSVVITVIDTLGETVFYERTFIPEALHSAGTIEFSGEVATPQFAPGSILKVYAWNTGEAPFYVEDFLVRFFGVLAKE